MKKLPRIHDTNLVGFETESDIIFVSFWDFKINQIAFRPVGNLVLVGKKTSATAETIKYTCLKRSTPFYTAPARASAPITARDVITYHFAAPDPTAKNMSFFFIPMKLAKRLGWAGPALSVFLLFCQNCVDIYTSSNKMKAFRLFSKTK